MSPDSDQNEPADRHAPVRLAVVDCLSVDRAPEVPGIYAWYARASISALDWTPSATETERDAITRFLSLITKHTGRMRSPPIDLVGAATFGYQWDGILAERLSRVRAEPEGLHRGEPSIELPNSAADAVATVSQRACLAAMLRAAVPHFASPIYVGVAINLRRRLRNHVDGFLTLSDRVRSDSSLRERLRRRRKQTFASRAVIHGLAPEHLMVYYLSLEAPDAQMTVGELRDVARLAEWLVNRWNRPLLGRR